MKIASRNAVGTIIGGVFILLIFSSIIAAFSVIDYYGQTRDEASAVRSEFINEKARENIEILQVTKKSNNFLNISVINLGSAVTKIVYIGEMNDISGIKYHRVDRFLMPLETATDILNNKIFVQENEKKGLQLLTSYGNQYFYQYDENSGSSGDATYDLVISVSGSGNTNPSTGTYSYIKGTDVDVSSIAGDGYLFDQWILDGSPVGSNNPITVSMNTDHTLEAVFLEGTNILIDDAFINLDNWESTNWQIQIDQWYSSPSSIKSYDGNEGILQSNEVDTSSAVELTISFWYRLSGDVDSTDVSFMIYDGLGGPDTIGYLDGVEDVWVYYEYVTSDPQYFIPNLYIRFDSSLRFSETIWIDDIKLTITQ